jgi:hypothetical protein
MIGEGLDGINQILGESVIGFVIFAQVPLLFSWLFLTVVMVSFFFFRSMVVVFPWAKRYPCTIVRPYVNNELKVFQDTGAICKEYGFARFKLDKAKEVMYRPSMTDIYSNDELVVLTIGPSKYFTGRRYIDYQNHIVAFGLTDPKLADAYYADKVYANNPNWIFDNFHMASILTVCWVFLTIIMSGVNFLALYPFALASILW